MSIDMPTKEEFREWCDYNSSPAGVGNSRWMTPSVNEIYSFFSSSHERVVEEIKKQKNILEKEQKIAEKNRYVMLEGICIAQLSVLDYILSKIQPKEDEQPNT